MSGILKLAFVGCGAISRFHLDGILESAPGIQVTAAIDPDPGRAEAIASETGAQVFTSLAEGIGRGDFDAVDLMLPHDLHESAAVQALEAGKHVLLEKPMAPDLDACERILAAAEKAGSVFMVGENAQYWPEIVKTRELVQSGAIGEIITARAAFVMEFDPQWFEGENPGAATGTAPVAALPSTAAPIGYGHCACGWGRSTRWWPLSTIHWRAWRESPRCGPCCASGRGRSPASTH